MPKVRQNTFLIISDHFHINNIFQCKKSETLKIKKPSLFRRTCKVPVLDQLLQSQNLIGIIGVLLHSALVNLCNKVRGTSSNHSSGLFKLLSLGKGTSIRPLTIYCCFLFFIIDLGPPTMTDSICKILNLFLRQMSQNDWNYHHQRNLTLFFSRKGCLVCLISVTVFEIRLIDEANCSSKRKPFML